MLELWYVKPNVASCFLLLPSRQTSQKTSTLRPAPMLALASTWHTAAAAATAAARPSVLLLILSLALSLLPPTAEAALDQEALELVWYDEFSGGSVDLDKWVVDEGDGCDMELCDWGNGEKQASFAIVLDARRVGVHRSGSVAAAVTT